MDFEYIEDLTKVLQSSGAWLQAGEVVAPYDKFIAELADKSLRLMDMPSHMIREFEGCIIISGKLANDVSKKVSLTDGHW